MSLRRTDQGFTLIEVSIVVVVLAVIAAVIAQSIFSLSRAESAMRGEVKASALAERVVAMIEADTASAIRVFSEGDEGRDYLTRLNVASLLAGGDRILAGSRMPVATMTGRFDRDPAGVVQTGNLLVLMRNDGVATCDTSADASGAEPRRVDLLRGVVWFLHAGTATGVDLGRFASGQLARLADIEAVADPARRTRLVKALRGMGVTHAWIANANPAQAFRTLSLDGTLSPLGSTAQLPADPKASQPRFLGTRFLGVARNNSVSLPVPKLATATAQFPHGFEVKRDGDGSGDLVLIRLVIASQGGAGRLVATAESSRQVAFRSE